MKIAINSVASSMAIIIMIYRINPKVQKHPSWKLVNFSRLILRRYCFRAVAENQKVKYFPDIYQENNQRLRHIERRENSN
jgi:hypothetical protein